MADAPSISSPVSSLTSTAPVNSTPDVNVDSSQVSTQAKPAAPVTPPASQRKKFNVKVDGVDEAVELDFGNEDDIKRHLQLSKAAQKRMQESANMRKGVQELLDTLRTDPLKVLTDPRLAISDDARKKLAEAIINNELEEMTKTPEQKEKERLQKEYERLQKEVQTERQRAEQAEMGRLQEQAAVQYDTEISGAIEESGLPKNARTVRYFAEALKFCVENDLPLSASDLVPYVKKQALSEFREVISALPDEDFENWLGKDQISRLRKRSVARASAPESPNKIVSTGSDAGKKNGEPSKKMLYRDFFKPF